MRTPHSSAAMVPARSISVTGKLMVSSFPRYPKARFTIAFKSASGRAP